MMFLVVVASTSSPPASDATTRRGTGRHTAGGSDSLPCSWAFVLASLHLLPTVVEMFCQSHRGFHQLMIGP